MHIFRHGRLKNYSIFIIFNIVFLGFITCNSDESEVQKFYAKGLINLDHLNYLCEDMATDKDTVTLVHIYADAPEYTWTDAKGEGIACVDDVARAAVVYLRYYELTGDVRVLKRIRRLLGFILMMQTEDGEFYNFVDRDLKINRTGRTSVKSFNFWAARGYWALGYGYKVFKSLDSIYAERLREKFSLCKVPLRKILENYGQTIQYGHRSYPTWLVNGTGSDATSELLLGIGYYLEMEKDRELVSYAEKLVDGILAMQLNTDDPYPGAFLSWRGSWHAYANAQTMALARLGKLFDEPEMIAAAEREAKMFYEKLIREEFFRSFNVNGNVSVKRFPQIAYDIRSVVNGLIYLYDITRKKEYVEWAGLAAAWFLGRNPAKRVMYHSETGRCYDGINSSDEINLNSGAESTIEALMTLLEVASHRIVHDRLMEWMKKNDVVKVSVRE